jgi:membrane protease YdiL (CAAX protease family)
MVPVTTGEQALPTISADRTSSAKLAWAALAYVSLLVVFWWIARYFHLKQLEEHPVSTVGSFALLFAPYWFFGFGAAERVRRVLHRPADRIAAAVLLTIPYFVLAIPRGEFRWVLAGALVGLAVFSVAALEVWRKPANWADLAVLGTVGLVIDLGLLSTSGPLVVPGATLWPPGLGGFPKLMMMNLALYCYLVVKPIEGIGYDLVPRALDVKAGLREFLFYAPFAILLGFFLGFLHFHRSWPQPFAVPAAWIFTFIFVAMPEELFFRGLMQNLLERLLGGRYAWWIASVIFGLSHFNKRAVFNWRYVLLATIAGLFYGRAWRERRRLFASSITHTSVDTVWSIWFR